MKKRLLFLLFLFGSLVLHATCPCELRVRQSFPGTNLPPVEEVHPCSALEGDIDSRIILLEGSVLQLSFCWTVRNCSLEAGVGVGGGVPFSNIRIQDDDGSMGELSLSNILYNQISCGAFNYFEYTSVMTYTAPAEFEDGFEGITLGMIIEDEDAEGNIIITPIGTINFKPLGIQAHAYDELTSEKMFIQSITSPNDLMGDEYSFDVATDGSRLLAFDFASGSLSIRDENNPEESGELAITMDGAEYISPQKFNPDVPTIFLDYMPPGATTPIVSIKLNLKPVPVMLLHGLGSDGSIWNELEGILQSEGWDASRVSTPSYDNDISFYASASAIHTYVENWVSQMKSEGLLMNKVNLVGHSMGGLVARRYEKNWGSDRVQKIVTLNTPHSGSELANFVMDGNFYGLGREMGELMFSGMDNFDINNGALASLRVNSDEILDLNSSLSDVKAHTIASVFELCDVLVPSLDFSNTINDRFRIFTGTAARFLGFAYYTIAGICKFHEFILPPPNDFVVGLESQQGGLSGSTNETFYGIFGTYHGSTTSNGFIINSLPKLLHASENDASFSDGFAPVTLSPLYFSGNGQADERAFRNSEVEINVNRIEPMDTIYASALPDIEIIGSSNVGGIMVGFYFPEMDSIRFDSVFANQHVFPISLPNGYEGELVIHAMGADGDGNLDYEGFVVHVSQGNPPLPEIPLLVSPADGAEDRMVDSELNWNYARYAAFYEVQVALDSQFIEIIVDSIGLTGSDLGITGLEFETLYYWRVRSINPTGQSEWSDTWSFTTLTAVPDRPALLFPPNDTTGIALQTTFAWAGVNGAEAYRVQIAEESSFFNTVRDEPGLTDTSFDVALPGYGSIYYWRVRANNTAGGGSWSEVWSFTTQTMTGIEESISKYALNVYPNPARESVFISFQSPAGAKVNITIYNSTGGLISVFEREVIAGRNIIEATLEKSPRGICAFRIIGDGIHLIGRFIAVN